MDVDLLGKRTRVDECNEERGNKVSQRSHSNESKRSMLADCSLEGLVLISKINHRNRSFIPSSKNYFGGIQVKKVLCDTGCSTCLLPLEENQIDDIFLEFPRRISSFLADIRLFLKSKI
jgi:hypothetical protein